MMKVRNKNAVIFMLFLTAAVLSVCFSGFAYEPFISAGAVRTKTIKFENAAGEELTSLSAGTVKASAVVKSVADGKKATLLVCAYDENEMVGFNESSTVLLPFNKSHLLEVTIDVPEGADALNAFVWSDSAGLFPYTQSAALLSDNIGVKSILLDGMPIEKFSEDTLNYEVSLNPGYMTYPEITVNTKDASAKVEITETPFLGEAPSSSIKITKGSKTKTYTVSYIKEAPQVFDAKINADNIRNTTGAEISEANQRVTTDILRDPETDTPTLVYNNRSDVYYQEFPDFLLGATAVQVARNLGSQLPANYDYAAYGDMMEFKINRSAEIYVHIDGATGFPWLSANGFALSDVTVKRWNRDVTFYKKTVYVEPGDSETVSLGYIKGGTDEPTILVKFLDELPETELIENAKIYKETDDSFILNAEVLKNVQPYGFVDSSLTGTELYAASNLTGAVKPFTASWRNYSLHLSDMLAGSDYIKLGFNWGDVTGSTSIAYYCTFDITKSATVYVNLWNFAANKDLLYAANPWLSGYDWIEENGDFEVGYIENGVLKTKSYGFKRSYTVEQGEKTTITVGPFMHPTNSTDPYTFPFVFVKAE